MRSPGRRNGVVRAYCALVLFFAIFSTAGNQGLAAEPSLKDAGCDDPTKASYSADPGIQAAAVTFWTYACGKDPESGTTLPLRKPFDPKVYRTPFGVQIDPYCFELMAPTPRQLIERNIDQQFRYAVENILGSCLDKYPELGSYAMIWAQRMARTVITCTSRTEDDIEAGAVNLNKNVFTKFATAAETERAAQIPELEVDTAKTRPLILFPIDGFARFKGPEGFSKLLGGNKDTWIIDSLIHEGMHSTWANNRPDHNDVERVDGDYGKCGKSAAVDRVNVIASMCSGDRLAGFKLSAEKVIYKRLTSTDPSCSRKTACEDLFNGDTASLEDPKKKAGTPLSQGMLDFDTAALCDKIFNEGCCREFFNTNEGMKSLLNQPDVRAPGKKAVARMDSLLPTSLDSLPAEALKAIPDVYKTFKRFEGNECFTKIFSGSLETGLKIKGAPTNALGDAQRWDAATLDRWRGESFNVAIEKMREQGECSISDARDRLAEALGELSDRMGKAVTSPVFTGELRARKFNGYENIGEFPEVTKEQREKQYALRTLLDGKGLFESLDGPSLFDDYTKAVHSHHPFSKDFSCAKLSIAEYGLLGCYSKIKTKPAELDCP